MPLALDFLVIAFLGHFEVDLVRLYPKMARNFLRVFNENQESERSVLIPIMVKKIEKKNFSKNRSKKIFGSKKFFFEVTILISESTPIHPYIMSP